MNKKHYILLKLCNTQYSSCEINNCTVTANCLTNIFSFTIVVSFWR